jgi:hypothetical protein
MTNHSFDATARRGSGGGAVRFACCYGSFLTFPHGQNDQNNDANQQKRGFLRALRDTVVVRLRNAG